jgi:predicted ATPase/class 3 adenylate cyclase
MRQPDVEAPSGIVTFVFTDIEGSTRLFNRLGESYVELLDRHNELLRAVWAECRGYEVSTEGDSFLVAFRSADDAVQAGADAQRALAGQRWPDGAEVRIRIGIHSGLASPHGSGYVSLAVHQAARVVAAAHGGQVLVTQDTTDRSPTLDGLQLRPLGRFRLRDFDEPIPLYQLAGAGLGEAFPAVRALPADGHNIVREPTPIIGRAELVADVIETLSGGLAVTLLGPGGVGKTRAAKEIGIEAAPSWSDGVWFVDLAGVTDRGAATAAIADAVGAPARSGGDRWDDALDHLRARRAVVIIDNCEHLLTIAADLVTSLQANCPEVASLVTSRQPLGVAAEVAWPVAPLDTPPDRAVDPPAVLATAAGRLFAERGSTARPGFQVDDGNASTVAEICRRLDGLPLAIELAAALLAVQSPAEILFGLEDRFRLLRSREGQPSDRHSSLEGVLAWSYQCLTEAEQTAFRRLSVFSGAFSIKTATAAVANSTPPSDMVPQLVWSLVDRSLVVADLSANATRYRLLETMRSYGRRLLDESGETIEVASSLAAAFAERLGPWFPASRRWVGDVGLELDNLRTLIPLIAADRHELAQTLACTIGRYHDATQTFRDGIDEVAGYVHSLAAPSPTRVSLLTTLADLHLRTGDTGSAERLVDEAEALRELHGAPDWDDVGVDRTRGEVARRSGDLAAAVEIARAALDRPLSDRGRPRMYNLLGTTSGALGDLATSREAFAKELELNEAIGYEWGTASAHGNLAEVAMRLGDTAGAARHQAACLDLAAAQGSTAMVAFSLIVAAHLAGRAGDSGTAVRLHAKGEELLAETGLALYDDDRRQSDDLLASARSALGEADFAAATEDGRHLEVTQAMTTARATFSAAQRVNH